MKECTTGEQYQSLFAHHPNRKFIGVWSLGKGHHTYQSQTTFTKTFVETSQNENSSPEVSRVDNTESLHAHSSSEV